MSPQEALREAEKRGLDLVEISPKATPPVCKLMDYGKFKYEQKKKSQSGKKIASSVLKEITLSPQTDVHDLNFKMKNSIGFLEEGHRVKISIRFRGREMAHPEIGRRQMDRVLEALKNHGTPEGAIKMEGKLLMATFVPMPTGTKKPKTSETSSAVNSEPKNPALAKAFEAKRSSQGGAPNVQ